jgi:peptide/nickel transport system ATP-binding protein
MSDALLSIRSLSVDYVTEEGSIRAVDGVSLDVHPGEIMGVAGESGSGKTTLAKVLLRILPPPGIITGGEVLHRGEDILRMREDALRGLRWNRISMVFQSAMDALNPVITVGEQMEDTLLAHGVRSRNHARARAAALLEMVGIDPNRLDSYAHQLSGGMRQRVGIALALALEPELVILDEPTTALDVIVERDILREIRELQRERGFSVFFITHDLARMLQVSDRVAVLYAGRLAEVGPAVELRTRPRHPYTQGLLAAFPSVRGPVGSREPITGSPPSLKNPPTGCRFHPRCPMAEERCRTETPRLIQIGPGHAAACHLLD